MDGEQAPRNGQVYIQIFEVRGYPAGTAIVPANSFVELPRGRFYGPIGIAEGKLTMARFFNWMEMNDLSPTGLKWSEEGQVFVDALSSHKG